MKIVKNDKQTPPEDTLLKAYYSIKENCPEQAEFLKKFLTNYLELNKTNQEEVLKLLHHAFFRKSHY